MKPIFIFVAIALIITGCKKAPFHDLSGDYSLKGVALIYDTLSGTYSSRLAKNLKIFLKYPGGAGYINSVTSNSEAVYSFNGIEKDVSYMVYSVTDTGTVKYYGQLNYPSRQFSNGQSDTLKLFPSKVDKSGLHVVVTDQNGGRISGATIWVFNSPVLFQSDTSAGRIFDLTTNEYGIANKFDIAPGTYYLRVKFHVNNIELTAESTVTIPDNRIQDVFMVLQNAALKRNGIELTIVDKQSNPVGGANVFFYRSNIIAGLDSLNTNSVFKLVSRNDGLAATYMIDPATYYYKAIRIIGKDTLQNKGSILVKPTDIAKDVVMLQ